MEPERLGRSAAGSMQSITVGLIPSDSTPASDLLACLRGFAVRVVDLPAVIGDSAVLRLRLQRLCPDVLVVDLTGGHQPLEEVMAVVRSVPDPPAVVAIGAQHTGDSLLEAFRAGVSEFLSSPIEEEGVRRALERLVRKRPEPAPSVAPGRVIAFLSPMGGSGATMLASHTAAALHRANSQRVLLADYDFAAGMAGFWTEATGAYSMLDAVRVIDRLDERLWDGLVGKAAAGFDVMPAPEDALYDQGWPVEPLVHVTQSIRTTYDWIVADLGHGLGPAALALAEVAETLYLVTAPDIAALYQLKRFLRKLAAVNLVERTKLVVNRFRKEQTFHRKEFEAVLGKRFEAILPEDVAEIEEAHAERRFVSPRSELGKRLAVLTAAISGVQPNPGPRSRFSMFG